jgi:hypothetical protein
MRKWVFSDERVGVGGAIALNVLSPRPLPRLQSASGLARNRR